LPFPLSARNAGATGAAQEPGLIAKKGAASSRGSDGQSAGPFVDGRFAPGAATSSAGTACLLVNGSRTAGTACALDELVLAELAHTLNADRRQAARSAAIAILDRGTSNLAGIDASIE
jgi:hypothetical protein